MKKKNIKKRKAFTLIELLAIIVILAIIAVITVPIILNIIENSKMGGAKDSAYGYKDAVNKYYVSKLAQDKDYRMEDGTYTTSELKDLGVSLSGQEPGTNSWVTINKNSVTDGCLQFDEYKVDIIDGKISNVTKEECVAPVRPIVYSTKGNETPKTVSNPLTDLEKENYVTIGEEGFYILSVDNDKVTLLADQCLINDNGTWRQKTGEESCTSNKFSSSNYWHDQSQNKLKDEYAYDVTGEKSARYINTGAHIGDIAPYVYYIPTGLNDSNDIDDIIEIYIETIPLSTNGRLMSYEEAHEISSEVRNISKSYWLGSAYSENYMWFVNINVYKNSLYNEKRLIRPVIEVPLSSF